MFQAHPPSSFIAVVLVAVADVLLMLFLFRVGDAGLKARQSLDVGDGIVGHLGRWYARTIRNHRRSIIYHSVEGLSIPMVLVAAAVIVMDDPPLVLEYTWWLLLLGLGGGMIDGHESFKRHRGGRKKEIVEEDESLQHSA